MTLVHLFVAWLIFVSGCAGNGSDLGWGYEGETGPEFWGDLSPAFALCSGGREQSPIDIADPGLEDVANIVFDYQPTPFEIINNGYTVQVRCAQGSTIEVDGAIFELKQFHFHAPGEHTFDGKRFAMEMHLAHESADGHLAVIGVMIEAGAYNRSLATLFDHLPAKPGMLLSVSQMKINADDLLPSERRSYRYDGSLTTPPCSEGVTWVVLTTPIELSETQIAAFEDVITHNSRPVQPLNNRTVVVDTSAN